MAGIGDCITTGVFHNQHVLIHETSKLAVADGERRRERAPVC